MKNKYPGDSGGDILIVDDELANLQLLSEILTAGGYEVRGSQNGSTALSFVESEPPELILLDIRMPEMDGYEVCNRLKSDPQLRNVPVIFLSALKEVDDKVRGFTAGAVDFITKPFQAEEVLARIDIHLSLSRLRRDLEGEVDKRTAEAIENEQKYRSIFNASPMSIIAIRDSRVLFSNLAGARMLGFSNPDEMIGMFAHSLVAPQYHQKVIERLNRLERGKDNPPTETVLVRKDGTLITVESRSVPITVDGKNTALIIAQDISERKEREKRLKKAEQALTRQLAFERVIADIAAVIAQSGIDNADKSISWILQCLGEFLHTDRSFLGQFSEKGDRLIFTNTWASEGFSTKSEIFTINMVDKIPWVVERIREGKIILASPGLSALPDEARELRDQLERDGITSGLAVPVRAEGKSIGIMGLDTIGRPREYPEVIVDRLQMVADMIGSMLLRIRNQKMLLESEAKFRAFMDNNPASIYIKDENDRHIYGNPAGIKEVGMKPDSFIGSTTRDIWPPEVADRLIELDQKVMNEDIAGFTEEWSSTEKGEVRWIRDVKFPIKMVSGKKLLGGIAFDITAIKQNEQKLQNAYNEINRLKQRLEKENIYLREEIELQHKHSEIIGNSQVVKEMLALAEQVANADTTVLIQGETGTGKELLARAIHRMSSRNRHPMIVVNCAALPDSLIESEMFGREKGAFTGALTSRVGRFEIADTSTILLDEIGELPLNVQSKLLRVLETGKFERLGSNESVSVDIRIIAATNRNLEKAVDEGTFRRDLFYRLNVFPITVPPLRDRIEDIEPLVWAFVQEYGNRMGKRIEKIPSKDMTALKAFPWKGNIRELRNVIEQSMIITTGTTMNVQLPGSFEASGYKHILLKDVERTHILNIVNQTGWRIRGKNGAAELLGLKPTTLEYRMKKLGINRPK